jgi:hypothetical protein
MTPPEGQVCGGAVYPSREAWICSGFPLRFAVSPIPQDLTREKKLFYPGWTGPPRYPERYKDG